MYGEGFLRTPERESLFFKSLIYRLNLSHGVLSFHVTGSFFPDLFFPPSLPPPLSSSRLNCFSENLKLKATSDPDAPPPLLHFVEKQNQSGRPEHKQTQHCLSPLLINENIILVEWRKGPSVWKRPLGKGNVISQYQSALTLRGEFS